MAQAIAWKEQVLAEGDVAPQILRDLKVFANTQGAPRTKSENADWSTTLLKPGENAPFANTSAGQKRRVPTPQLPPASSQLTPGTKLVKAYAGRNHVVEVTEDGLHYDGQLYRSLSAIAKEITGTHWNGLLFFGLRKRKTYPAKRAANG